MNDNYRYILAGLLIFLIILLQPVYLEWLGLGYDAAPEINKDERLLPYVDDILLPPAAEDIKSPLKKSLILDVPELSPIVLVTPLYIATLSSRSGGSFEKYALIQKSAEKLKYSGGYGDDGHYNKDVPVSLILSNENYCLPCLAAYDDLNDRYDFINFPFRLISYVDSSDTLFLFAGESKTLEYVLNDGKGNPLIRKSVTFSADNFVSLHSFSINEENFDYYNNLEIMWDGGLRPSEEKLNEDIQYSSGIISQAGELEDLQVTGSDKNISRTLFSGKTDWTAIRSKYFINALLADTPGSFASMSAQNIGFGEADRAPLYKISIGYPLNTYNILARVYLGPLDIDYISQTGTTLDETMNWGWVIIRPISKGILWVLKFMHNALHLNYGLVLLLFALLIRLITGPLTKKSYESTQKMQKIQPEIKKMQSKYKGDSQRLNREMMGMYKKHGVNPLGGCLPMVIQMPLLMALFIVFRTTIEFRGQPFILWIKDLSKPDIVFHLPFNIPIYGDGVAILPLLMGVTLFLTMRMSSATMDKSQKPVMYFMNGFFILLFNTFPSGLNLYYTTYNIFSFLQQQGIKKRLAS